MIVIALIFSVLYATIDAQVDEPAVNLGSQGDFFEGDIQLTVRNRNGILAANRWPNNTVIYQFADGWTESFIPIVETAIRAIEASTCIKFVKRTTQNNYANIKQSTTGGCHAVVGMAYGAQPVNLMHLPRRSSCVRHHIIVHELLHTIGLWHEQSRDDRDDYITVNYDNIDKSKWSQFSKLSQNQSSTYGVPYNYLSVMHYDQWAFGLGGKVTMTTKDPAMQTKIGYANYGHELDFEKVRRIYKCQGTYTPATTTPTTVRTTSTPKECFDSIPNCKEWAGSCTAGWAQESCRKFCKLCK